MSYFISGGILIAVLLGSLIALVFKRENELKKEYQERKKELEIVNKLVSYAKLHNDGKDISDVINSLKDLEINYNPKNSL